MPSNLLRDRPASATRRGVSFVEFIGCLAAMGGGLVLGSIYLGLDVKAMAVGILEKAAIDVPTILSDSAPDDKEAAVGDSSTIGQPAELPTVAAIGSEATVDNALEALDAPPANGATIEDENESAVPLRKPLTSADKEAATRVCWAALNQAVQEESANRSNTISDAPSWQLFDYLLHREAGHQSVVDTIKKLDQHGLDQRLRVHIQQLLAWHQAGVKLSGPLAQSWQSAATQHRMEEKLILAKHAAVASYLEHSHKLPASTGLGQ